MRFSTGAALTGEILVKSLGSTGNRAIVDWDSDGYDDIAFATGGTWEIYRCTGEGFVSAGSTGIAAGYLPTAADINGDGLTDLASQVSGSWRFSLHSGGYPDLLQSATDGYGNVVTFNYAPLTTANYTKHADAVYPEVDYQGPMYVVDSHTGSNGVGGTYTTTYQYYGARVHLQGRGFEGFYARRAQDDRNNLNQFDYFHRLFPYTGSVFQSDLYQSNGTTLISRTQATWSAHAYGSGAHTRSLPYVSSATSLRYEVGGTHNGALIATTTTTNSVHAATGAIYDTTTTTTEAAAANGVQSGAIYTQRVYQPTAELVNDTASWCIGRPGRIESTNSHSQHQGSALTRTTTMDWDESKCRPTEIVSEPNDSLLQVTRTLGCDDFGNVDSDTITGIGMAARATTASWGTTGQFPEQVTNALSQMSTLEWDYAIGAKTGETDPNGITTAWQYDAFGRRTRETRPDGTATTWSYNDCVSFGCLSTQNKMVIVESVLDATGATVNDQRVYMDRFDRPIVTSGIGLSGARTRVEREYDALGRLYCESAPCWWSGCALFWNTFTYDAVNRVTQISRPVSDSDPTLQTTYSYYEGLTTRVVDALSKQTTKVANVVGGLARSADHDGYYQSFDYNPFGNLVRVTDSLGNTLLSNTFNLRGSRTAQTDLAAGSWTYIPNALGEVTSQTDAKSQTTTFGYDLLGRLTSRIEPEGTSTFTFGTSAAAHNIGRLSAMSGPGYSESYSYDAVGRVQTRSISSDASYTIDYTYNSFGALDTLTYPTSTESYRLKLQYDYQNGHLLRVKDFNQTSTVFWTANGTDARGNIIDEALGNGVQTIRGYDQVTGWIDYIQSGSGGSIQNLSYAWDRVGNLTIRQDARQGLTENFYYDNLHRLTSATGPDPISIGYDARGNITSRSGAISPGATHTIEWTSYNLPSEISATSNNSSQFYYAPDRSRWKQGASYGGTSEHTIYIGGLVEKVTLGATISWKHYIAGGSGPVAIYTRKNNGTNELHYLTTDHLGSVDSVTNASGAIEARLSYGALGQRRDEDTWSGNPTPQDWTGVTNTTRHGFTFHEMLDNLNLVHMNGRVYDQLIGRFTSADPFIDGSEQTAGWNRFSYVHNNPLSFVDPSGYTKRKDGGRISWINHDIRSLIEGGGGVYGGGLAPDGISGGGGGGGRGRGGGGDAGDGDSDESEPDDKCWNGEQGDVLDFADGLARQILNDLAELGSLIAMSQSPLQAGLGCSRLPLTLVRTTPTWGFLARTSHLPLSLLFQLVDWGM